MPISEDDRTAGARVDPDELWTFAVVADTHINASGRATNSPWKANAQANGRARAVLAEIERSKPDFVLHLGDIVHPVPSHADYDAAVTTFQTMVDSMSMPVHLVPGNHDVGDKPMAWTPAEIVNPENVERYEQKLGPSYYHFDHRGCRFVAVNAQLFNSGFDIEHDQWLWLDRVLAEAKEMRRFVFLHYPPFILHADEPGNYDNLDEPGRSRFLDLVVHHDVEAIFAGHVHNFFFTRYENTDIYCAPATSFVRNDYHEFGRASLPIETESGRNDVAKLGHFVIEMGPEGHVPLIHRSYGQVDAELLAIDVGASGPSWRLNAPCAVDLRHAWAEEIEIPYTGGVDEFARKRARNDYPLLALWELGIGVCRLPLHDLTDERTRARLEVLHSKGYRFVPFVLGAPTRKQTTQLVQLAPLVEALEVVLPGAEDPATVTLPEELAAAGIEIAFSRMLGHGDVATGTGVYSHAINHGYLVDDLTEKSVEELAEAGVRRLVVRLGKAQDPLTTIARLEALLAPHGIRAHVQVRMAGEVPTGDEIDPDAAQVRVIRALLAGMAYPEHLVVLDNLAQHDRGYFRRPGMLDRNNNPTDLGNIVRSLSRVFADEQDVRIEEGEASTLVVSQSSRYRVVYPSAPLSFDDVLRSHPDTDGAVARAVVHLAAGQYLLDDDPSLDRTARLTDGPVLLVYPVNA
ncbi:metallophosphoesterase [Nocardioides carbamazepini]|uniref:metallophosphoesterase family protein n=1 Tax=Nocardioides carbamazepini TaxID=2854259 RepID=UPI00214A050C|nr:metallophosphoesterase [Nocardioides carbamazepini]MCR1784998.1 metallophosphoesterase [Nocardioides carbamazepini]